MADDTVRQALEQLGMTLGMKALQNLGSLLDPEKMVDKATEILSANLRDAVKEILNDPQEDTTASLLDRLFEELDIDEVIQSIAKPLADSFTEYLKENMWSDVVAAIVEEMEIDEDDLMDRVATQLSSRVRLDPTT